jgi:hypothetical protein
MATVTLGTNGTGTLAAVSFQRSLSDADIATIQQAILEDKVLAAGSTRAWPGAFARTGLLYIPNRGVLQVLPGDYVATDSSGWPILISRQAIAAGGTSWTHT